MKHIFADQIKTQTEEPDFISTGFWPCLHLQDGLRRRTRVLQLSSVRRQQTLPPPPPPPAPQAWITDLLMRWDGEEPTHHDSAGEKTHRGGRGETGGGGGDEGRWRMKEVWRGESEGRGERRLMSWSLAAGEQEAVCSARSVNTFNFLNPVTLTKVPVPASQRPSDFYQPGV